MTASVHSPRWQALPFVTGKFPNIPAIGDVNGDGVADVAVSSPDGDTITVFTMSRACSPCPAPRYRFRDVPRASCFGTLMVMERPK